MNKMEASLLKEENLATRHDSSHKKKKQMKGMIIMRRIPNILKAVKIEPPELNSEDTFHEKKRQVNITTSQVLQKSDKVVFVCIV